MSEIESDVTHQGGCHCGAVRYKVLAPPTVMIFNCNCSICHKKQNRHFIVPHSKFTLLQGENSLTTYTFNTRQAKHMFCKVCGVQSFYQPRSNPDGYGVMPHCIDSDTITEMQCTDFDGRNWETSMKTSDIGKYSEK